MYLLLKLENSYKNTNKHHTMPRRLLATDHPSDPLTSLKISFASATFLTTLVAGISAYKLLSWRGEKWTLIVSRFAAGVFLGTAMIECLCESDIMFHVLGFRYPVAFSMTCTGYLVAMLVECVLAGLVQMLSQGCSTKSYFKFLGNLRLVKSWYAISSVGISESETKDFNDIGYRQNRILNKATQLGDGFFLIYILSVFSMAGGSQIASADAESDAWKNFLSAMLHNIMYIVSLISLLLKFSFSIPTTAGVVLNFIPRVSIFLAIWFSFYSPVGFVTTFILPDNDSMVANKSALVSILYNRTLNKWTYAILMGYTPGVLVYILAHHLLVDGYEMKGAVPQTRFSKFLSVVLGVGLIGFVKMLNY